MYLKSTPTVRHYRDGFLVDVFSLDEFEVSADFTTKISVDGYIDAEEIEIPLEVGLYEGGSLKYLYLINKSKTATVTVKFADDFLGALVTVVIQPESVLFTQTPGIGADVSIEASEDNTPVRYSIGAEGPGSGA
jgi:hypothetical protein